MSMAPTEAAGIPPLGARPDEAGTRFGLFARPGDTCGVRLFDAGGCAISDHALPPLGDGYFGAHVPEAKPGTLYKFIVDGRELPDPFARFLPMGVHGPAQVMLSRYEWRNGTGVSRPLSEQVIYELHVGTFSDAGTYDGAAARLPELAELGVTTVELMPVAAFPGARGWGYEGVALFAPFALYGPPDELRAFVDAAHGLGLAVLLDVVYNHFGPAGNYLPSYCAAYLTKERHNGWGDAPDFTFPVLRRMIVENARYWLDEFRLDGLRLDATHAIDDPTLLRVLADVVKGLGADRVLIAEDNRNDPSLVTEHGIDAIWADDFHNQLHVCLTDEQEGYYRGYRSDLGDLARTINRGWLYEGQPYAPLSAPRGSSAEGLAAPAFVYCLQNHDQVGNRALGDRLSAVIAPELYRAASMLLLFLPMTPLLFMGQEWAASSPFLFFTDHDEELGRLVREGRREEFKDFAAFSDPGTRERIPDPQAPRTFEASRLRWDERGSGEHAGVLALYRALLAMRAADPVLRSSDRRALTAEVSGDVLIVARALGSERRVLLMNFGPTPVQASSFPLQLKAPKVLLRSDGAQTDTVEAVSGRSALILAGSRV